MKNEAVWHVIYTKSKHEKTLAEQLSEAGFTVYLPLVKRENRWSDRKKTVEVPLFNSYVFIQGVKDKSLMKDFKSFVAFLQHNNKPAIVRQHEIDTLKRVIKHGYDVRDAGDISQMAEGSKVMVIAGPLKGMTGQLLSIEDNDWFLLEFDTIGNGLQVKIPPLSLKKI